MEPGANLLAFARGFCYRYSPSAFLRWPEFLTGRDGDGGDDPVAGFMFCLLLRRDSRAFRAFDTPCSYYRTFL